MTSQRRNRPEPRESPRASPGGDAWTDPREVEEGDEGVVDDETVTRPHDVEGAEGPVSEPDDGATTEPVELEPPERRQRPKKRRGDS